MSPIASDDLAGVYRAWDELPLSMRLPAVVEGARIDIVEFWSNEHQWGYMILGRAGTVEEIIVRGLDESGRPTKETLPYRSWNG